MTTIETAVSWLSLVLFGGICVYAYRYTKKRRPFHENLEKVKDREADLEGVRIVAERLGADMAEWIAKSGRSRLFASACGDMFEDFFPAEEPDHALSPEERGNLLLVAYFRRVADAEAKRGMRADAKSDLCFCEGAGFGLLTMRRLSEHIPELAAVADAMAEPPSPENAEEYAAFYREAGRIAKVRDEWVEEGLAGRLEQYRADAAAPE